MTRVHNRTARRPVPRPPLSNTYILRLADEFRRRHGRWPRRDDGLVDGVIDLTWCGVDQALRKGHRGLTGGSSLARLLRDCRRRRHRQEPPTLSTRQILSWADAHFRRTGVWPIHASGLIPGTLNETWNAVDKALRAGRCGLPGGSSLPQLLEAERGVRNHLNAPRLTTNQILGWADAHHAQTGRWPTTRDGPIHAAPDETWHAVDASLMQGVRGLPGGSSLARLLDAERGVRNPQNAPRLTEKLILSWADAHHARTGRWPTVRDGSAPGVPDETWVAVDSALAAGCRGLPGGDTLARLLARRRGVRNRRALPKLSVRNIRAWAEAHFRRTGARPKHTSGAIPEAPGETWGAVHHALREGGRGLPGGSSLYKVTRPGRAQK